MSSIKFVLVAVLAVLAVANARMFMRVVSYSDVACAGTASYAITTEIIGVCTGTVTSNSATSYLWLQSNETTGEYTRYYWSYNSVCNMSDTRGGSTNKYFTNKCVAGISSGKYYIPKNESDISLVALQTYRQAACPATSDDTTYFDISLNNGCLGGGKYTLSGSSLNLQLFSANDCSGSAQASINIGNGVCYPDTDEGTAAKYTFNSASKNVASSMIAVAIAAAIMLMKW